MSDSAFQRYVYNLSLGLGLSVKFKVYYAISFSDWWSEPKSKITICGLNDLNLKISKNFINTYRLWPHLNSVHKRNFVELKKKRSEVFCFSRSRHFDAISVFGRSIMISLALKPLSNNVRSQGYERLWNSDNNKNKATRLDFILFPIWTPTAEDKRSSVIEGMNASELFQCCRFGRKVSFKPLRVLVSKKLCLSTGYGYTVGLGGRLLLIDHFQWLHFWRGKSDSFEMQNRTTIKGYTFWQSIQCLLSSKQRNQEA